MTEPNDRPVQPDLFGEVHTEFPFDVVLCGLMQINGLGRQGIAALADSVRGNLGRLWDLPFETIGAALSKARVPQVQAVMAQIEDYDTVLDMGARRAAQLKAANIHVVSPPLMPKSLRVIDNPPRWLFVEGDPNVLLRRPAVAVVGTRNASVQGLRATRLVVQILEGYPVTVVSGLAEGIDDEAHRSSLGNRLGNVAFLGHGIDIVFPQSTKGTRARILDKGGAIATEYLPGEMYQRSYFVQRNRLQAGLADLVIAVEAQAKSGTAHTIDFALKYRKPVVGIRVEGSSIVTTIEKAGQSVVDIESELGNKSLDALINQLTQRAGHRPDPFASSKERLRRDLKIRNRTPEQLVALATELFAMVIDESERAKERAKGELL